MGVWTHTITLYQKRMVAHEVKGRQKYHDQDLLLNVLLLYLSNFDNIRILL